MSASKGRRGVMNMVYTWRPGGHEFDRQCWERSVDLFSKTPSASARPRKRT
ncbi:hypothetical protein DPMN_158028 [Dreissena polymorpha]|uniref:Uncharacterized protein n=1 Tax=Dreissena polymorpha TaxID=45954 RepID=A0A9D4IPE4_DREPO|nr:hypothetical protein DPMN_158028 [Dreissena polymorpha]